MSIIFKKNGRPTKVEKKLVKKINTFLDTLSEDEKSKYNFADEIVTNKNRLDEIWSQLSLDPADKVAPKVATQKKTPEVNETQKKEVAKEEWVDTDTGEISNSSEPQPPTPQEPPQENTTPNEITENNMEEYTNFEEIADSSEADNEIPKSFNPLADPVKQRSYNKPLETNVGDIPEPEFKTSTSVEEELKKAETEGKFQFEDNKEAKTETNQNTSSSSSNSEPSPLANPAMNDMDSKDKTAAAERMVDSILDGYESLHQLGQNFVQIAPEKIQEKIMNNEFDPSMKIPLDESGEEVSTVEFLQEFNQQAAEVFTYDKKFNDKVRQPMIRIFAKKGWGMTNEQYVLMEFGKDLSWKGLQVYNLKKQGNHYMNMFMSMHKENLAAQKQQEQPTQSVKPDSITTPPPAPEPHYEQHPSEPTDEDTEYEEETNSTDVIPIHS